MQNQNTCKPLQATPIQTIHNNTTNHKQHHSYRLKLQGRITIASLFLVSAIMLGCIYPQAGEGSVFFVVMSLIIACNKDIRINLNSKQ